MKKLVILMAAVMLLALPTAVWAAPVTDSLDVTVYKASVKPVIDGKISDGEWGDAVMYQEPGLGYTYFPDGEEIMDQGVKANIYMLWDESGYYVAASVEDEAYFNQYSNLDIWNGDAMEFDSNFNKDDYTDRNRQCYGMNNDGEIFGGSYKVASGVDWQENAEIEFTEYTVSRNGTTTVYEFFVPWANFCPDGTAFAKVGNQFRGNVQFHLATDGDYIGCQRYVKVEGETVTYPNFILADAAPVAAPETEAPAAAEETAAAEAEAPVTEAAPQTSDVVSTVIVAVAAAAVCLVVIKKSARA